MQELLTVNNLKKYFKVSSKDKASYVKAVDDVSFTIKERETFGLVGESGCGKSTIGRLILRLIEADDGEIIFNGVNIRTLNKKELQKIRKDIQIVFQDPYGSLNPRMTVEQLVSEPILKHEKISKEDLKKRVSDLLNTVGIDPRYMDKYPHEFSGGQRQRVVIARALSVNPKLIVCDEPVSALDVSIQAQILNLLKDLKEKYGVAFLFIAHGMATTKHISDRVGVMYLGKLVEVANTDEIFDGCVHPYTKALMSAVPIPDPESKRERKILKGEVPSPLNPPTGCRFNTRCDYACDICRQVEPELKEVRPNHYVACHFSAQF